MLVALTANAFHGAREEYLAQGFDDYLSKPILPPALRQLITRVGKKLKSPTSADLICLRYYVAGSFAGSFRHQRIGPRSRDRECPPSGQPRSSPSASLLSSAP